MSLVVPTLLSEFFFSLSLSLERRAVCIQLDRCGVGFEHTHPLIILGRLLLVPRLGFERWSDQFKGRCGPHLVRTIILWDECHLPIAFRSIQPPKITHRTCGIPPSVQFTRGKDALCASTATSLMSDVEQHFLHMENIGWVTIRCVRQLSADPCSTVFCAQCTHNLSLTRVVSANPKELGSSVLGFIANDLNRGNM